MVSECGEAHVTIGYIVLAYKAPEQILRLLRRIATDDNSVVVHVDSIMDDAHYDDLTRRAGALGDVHFLDRTRTYWGGFELIHATLRALERLGAMGRVDYAILLTGQDYPVCSTDAIEQFLHAAEGRSFLHNSPLPYAAWGPNGGLERIERWHVMRARPHRIRLPWKRAIPGGLQPFGGEAYWCLSRPVVDHICGFTHENPTFTRFFRHVFVPDEIFFQTIVMNSPFRDEVINDTLHFVDWSVNPGPATLREADVPRITTSGKLFARKFDIAVDSGVLDALDRHGQSEAVGA